LDQVCSQVQILTSLLIYGDQGLRIALSKASTRACASLPEDVSTVGFRSVALLWTLDDGQSPEKEDCVSELHTIVKTLKCW